MSALTCQDCGQTYRPTAGHCRGGRFGGCCRSFRTSADFDQHRTGAPSDPANPRRCLTDQELAGRGWRRDGHLWLSPAGARSIAKGAALRDARNGPDVGEGAPSEEPEAVTVQ